jgi:hypothetical protein
MSPTKFDKVRQSPTKSDKVRQSPKKSDKSLTKSEKVRQSPKKSEKVRQSPTKSDKVRQSQKIIANFCSRFNPLCIGPRDINLPSDSDSHRSSRGWGRGGNKIRRPHGTPQSLLTIYLLPLPHPNDWIDKFPAISTALTLISVGRSHIMLRYLLTQKFVH